MRPSIYIYIHFYEIRMLQKYCYCNRYIQPPTFFFSLSSRSTMYIYMSHIALYIHTYMCKQSYCTFVHYKSNDYNVKNFYCFVSGSMMHKNLSASNTINKCTAKGNSIDRDSFIFVISVQCE